MFCFALDSQVDLLSRVHHKNLLSLIGYCNESKEVMLIYELMSGGSLRDHLYGEYIFFKQYCLIDFMHIYFDTDYNNGQKHIFDSKFLFQVLAREFLNSIGKHGSK